MSSFTDAPVIKFSHPKETFGYIVEPFAYAIGHKNSPAKIHIEAGFITDGVSVPWFASWLFKRHGHYLKAAIVHDRLYSSDYVINGEQVTRKEADQIFYQALRVLGCGSFRASIAYVCVRWFGRWGWRRARRGKY